MSENITKITIPKDVYEEFKYFKNIYTKINFADRISLIGDSKNNRVLIHFLDISEFTVLVGYLYGDTQFLKWLKNGDKHVSGKFQHFIDLGKTLKKNVDSVGWCDDYFYFYYKNKEDLMCTFMMKLDSTISSPKILETEFEKEFEICDDFLKSDILQIFESDGKISEVKTTNKIIEIPKARVYSLIKNEKLFLNFTEKDEEETRIIKLRSKSDDLNLELVQYFRTI